MVKRVLNVGSGPSSARQLHPVFSRDSWTEIRLDIDPLVKPDLVGSVTDMVQLVSSATLDAVWSSHSLEHFARTKCHKLFRNFGVCSNQPDSR